MLKTHFYHIVENTHYNNDLEIIESDVSSKSYG